MEEIKIKNRDWMYSEYLRLFYVAITRAENELYLCALETSGSSPNGEIAEETKNTWYKISREALIGLGAREREFEFRKTDGSSFGNKFVFGEALEQNICSGAPKTKVETSENAEIIEKILGNMKKYTQKEVSSQVIFPSEFFNHYDRDNPPGSANRAMLRGRLIHRLLAILPKVDSEHWDEIINYSINNLSRELLSSDREEIKKMALRILSNEKFQEFFSENSRAEVALIGEIDGSVVSGRVDRLVNLDDRVALLEYKSTKNRYSSSAAIPENYRRQLELYKKLIEKLNPTKTVECYILFTAQGELMRVF
jgi:ATP-dependent helicase/nuclease subunit A